MTGSPATVTIGVVAFQSVPRRLAARFQCAAKADDYDEFNIKAFHMSSSTELARHPRAGFGSIALFCGVALLVLCGMESMSEAGLPGMPRFWHANQLIWWVIAAAAMAAGVLLLAPRNVEVGVWKPTRPGIRFQHMQMYTRVGCHLCDDAAAVLEQHRRWLPRIVTIDVDTDARLRAIYGDCVPVVTCDGRVRFKGRVPVALLRRLIEGT